MLRDGEDVDFEGVDFISFVSGGTFGKPAIIAPGTDGFVPASASDRPVTVLYVNPGLVPALKATKSP